MKLTQAERAGLLVGFLNASVFTPTIDRYNAEDQALIRATQHRIDDNSSFDAETTSNLVTAFVN